MKLYAYYRSSTSYRLRIALNLKGLDYTVAPVNIFTGEQHEAAYKAIDPFASVPAMACDAEVYTQSMAMLEWLEERWPEPGLLPGDVDQRFAARELAMALATDLHALLNLSTMQWLRSHYGEDDAGIRRWYHHWLARSLPPVEARLVQRGSGDYLHAAPGLFECVLIPQLYNARRFGFDLAPFPRMTRIEAACLPLPAFVAAHPDNQPDCPKDNPAP